MIYETISIYSLTALCKGQWKLLVMRLPPMEMVFAFLLLHLIQYNVEGKHFLVETKNDNTRSFLVETRVDNNTIRTPSGLVCEYFFHFVCKIANLSLSLKWVCTFSISHQCFVLIQSDLHNKTFPPTVLFPTQPLSYLTFPFSPRPLFLLDPFLGSSL